MRINGAGWLRIGAALTSCGVVAALAAFLGLHEGVVYTPYRDAAGVLTVCYGHTDRAGTGQVELRKYSEAECEAFLASDTATAAKCIDQNVTAPITKAQRVALESFIFNEGCGNFQKSTLRRKLNAKDYAGAGREFSKWTKGGGKVLKELQDRRADEKILWSFDDADVDVGN
jgi:lysozyme